MIYVKTGSTRGGTRTPTPVKVLDPKSSASTNSATLAQHLILNNDLNQSLIKYDISPPVSTQQISFYRNELCE